MALKLHGCRQLGALVALGALCSGSAAALVAQDPPAVAAASSGQPAVASWVAAGWSATTVSRGTWVVVRGRVSTATVRRNVLLQALTPGRWRTVNSTATVAGGAYAMSVPTWTLGTTTYRLLVPAVARYEQTAAALATVTVRLVATPGNAGAYAFLSRTAVPTAPVARWNPCSTIVYRVNLAQASQGALADVQGALARVSAATGLRFAFAGTTTLVPTTTAPYPQGTDLVLGWVTPGSTDLFPKAPSGYDAAGYGGAAWDFVDVGGATHSQIVQGYALFNADLPLTAGFGAGPVYGWQGTRGQLIMHEVGHAIGLAHPLVPDPDEIMYPTMTRKVAQYAAGDLAGLRMVGAAQGCLTATPPGVSHTAALAGAEIPTRSWAQPDPGDLSWTAPAARLHWFLTQ